ncbi:uncharacterized protein LOC132550047, partial [Ylistrum balloti]|uniref:uncharacterized protein LOC132550047 n=1 Tax=Ylistrum balloti TaxID=509963 RepID=UPI002905A953
MPGKKPINYRNQGVSTRSQKTRAETSEAEINNDSSEEVDISESVQIDNSVQVDIVEEPDETSTMAHIQIKKYDGTESPQLWYSSMEAWMTIQNYSEQKMLSALPLILEGPAALWIQTQPQASTASLENFKTAFFDRFGTKDNDMTFMSLKQENSETALAFIERAEKTGLGAALPECYKVKAATQGLLPSVRARVIGKEPTTFLDLRKAVQLATEELECFVDSSEVKSIDLLVDKFTQMTKDLSSTIVQQVNQLQQQQQNQQRRQQQQPWKQSRQQQQHYRQSRTDHHHQSQRQCQGCGVNSVFQLWTILAVMFLCIPLVVTDSSPIQRLNYGILFEPTAQLHLGQEYWTHTFKIPLPTPSYLPGIPTCKRQTCKMANQVVDSLNNLHTQCMSNVNSTVREIHRLIPHSYFPNTHSSGRSKRGLLDFIGQISKSL